MLQLGPLIIRNVLRNKRRSLLTLASATVSLAVLGLIVAIYQGFFYAEQTSPAEALRLITRHKVSLTNPLPASYQGRIASIDGVAAITSWTWYEGKFKNEKPENFFARFACDPAQVQKVYPEYTAPPEQWKAFEKNRTGCAIGRKIADKQGMKLGDRLNIAGNIYPVDLELTIECIFDHPKNTELMMFQREYLDQLMREKRGTGGDNVNMVGTFAMLTNSEQDLRRVARAIDTMFENSTAPTKTETVKEFSLYFIAFLGNMKVYLGAVCAAITFTILLVSANTVAMSVRERTKETAMLRTLGYTPGEILSMILVESILIAVIGGAIGLLFTFGLTKMAEAVMGPWGAGMVLHWQAAAVVALAAILIGFFAALVPAYFASRKNIVESLRFTG